MVYLMMLLTSHDACGGNVYSDTSKKQIDMRWVQVASTHNVPPTNSQKKHLWSLTARDMNIDVNHNSVCVNHKAV